jgi:hypothetical protein
MASLAMGSQVKGSMDVALVSPLSHISDDSHIIGHMLLGLQTLVVVGESSQLPRLPEAYQSAYLSPGQADAMGNIYNDTQFIPYFISVNSTDPTTINP